MSERPATNRRAFFGRAWRDVLATVAETQSPEPVSRARVRRAAPATGMVTLDELLAHAATVGLGDRAEAISSLARRSVRLTPGAEDGTGTTRGGSRLGGRPALPPGAARPTADGRALPCLAQVDLAAIDALAAAPQLPAGGRLLFFADIGGAAPGRAVAGQVLVAPAAEADAVDDPLEHSLELSLPRAWSDLVEALALSDEEREGWQQLRAWLAERQGVELHGGGGGFVAPHRLFGYPDETGGDMPLLCELLAAGEELSDSYPRMHPRARELEPQASRWRLLLQVSIGRERVYFWAPSEDLDAADFSRVYAIR